MERSTKLSGFTLIELLVVVSIIALLSSVVLSSLTTARAKSRDARRLADGIQLRTALELYANDNAGQYPSNGNQWWGNCSSWGSHALTGSNGYIPNLAPTYISILPLDPKPLSTTCYLYNSTGTDYMLLLYGQVETYSSSNNPRKRPSYPGEPSFAFYTTGASTW